MEFRMGMWLLATLGIGTLMFFWHKRKSEKSEQVGSSDHYSNITLYFDPINGEGHLFIGGAMVIVSFSLFCYELAKMIVSLAGI